MENANTRSTKFGSGQKPGSPSVRKLILVRGIGELLTMDGVVRKNGRHVQRADLGLVSGAAILIGGGRILMAGSEADVLGFLKQIKAAGSVTVNSQVVSIQESEIQEFHVGGRDVMPAFVEAHTHLCFAGSREDEFESRNQGATYQEIAARGGGILSTVSKTRAASEMELQELSRERMREFARQGVTTVEAKSGYGLDLESEIKILRALQGANAAFTSSGNLSGPRMIPTFLGAHAIPPSANSTDPRVKADDYLELLLRDVVPVVAKEQLARRADIFLEKNYFEQPLARKYLETLRKLGFELTIHADQLSHSGGGRMAVELQAKSADHVLCIDDADVQLLAKSNVTCGLLPGADLYLRCDYPPARKLIDAGARVFLATDFNPGTCPTQDLSLIGLLARLEMKMTLPETLAAYTWNAAESLSLGDQVGSLQSGRLADFVVLDQNWSSLFYSVGQHRVHSVWREGQQIV